MCRDKDSILRLLLPSLGCWCGNAAVGAAMAVAFCCVWFFVFFFFPPDQPRFPKKAILQALFGVVLMDRLTGGDGASHCQQPAPESRAVQTAPSSASNIWRALA